MPHYYLDEAGEQSVVPIAVGDRVVSVGNKSFGFYGVVKKLVSTGAEVLYDGNEAREASAGVRARAEKLTKVGWRLLRYVANGTWPPVPTVVLPGEIMRAALYCNMCVNLGCVEILKAQADLMRAVTGTVYNVEMCRRIARRWVKTPQSATQSDPLPYHYDSLDGCHESVHEEFMVSMLHRTNEQIEKRWGSAEKKIGKEPPTTNTSANWIHWTQRIPTANQQLFPYKMTAAKCTVGRLFVFLDPETLGQVHYVQLHAVSALISIASIYPVGEPLSDGVLLVDKRYLRPFGMSHGACIRSKPAFIMNCVYAFCLTGDSDEKTKIGNGEPQTCATQESRGNDQLEKSYWFKTGDVSRTENLAHTLCPNRINARGKAASEVFRVTVETALSCLLEAADVVSCHLLMQGYGSFVFMPKLESAVPAKRLPYVHRRELFTIRHGDTMLFSPMWSIIRSNPVGISQLSALATNIAILPPGATMSGASLLALLGIDPTDTSPIVQALLGTDLVKR